MRIYASKLKVFCSQLLSLLSFSLIIPLSHPAHGDIIGKLDEMKPVTGSLNPMRYREGYVLGTVAKVADRGFFFHTLEGQVKLGVTSTQGGFVDQGCLSGESLPEGKDVTAAQQDAARSVALEKCTIPVNPWPFSNYNQELIANFDKITGRLVLAYFRSYSWMPLLDSDNYLLKIYLVDPTGLKEGDFYDAREELTLAGYFHYSKGSVEGRIVQASIDGVVRKHYTFLIQIGPTGDLFQQVNVSNEDLFKYGLKAMSTGQFLRIYYYELLSPLSVPLSVIKGYSTDLRASRIEVIQDPRAFTTSAPQR